MIKKILCLFIACFVGFLTGCFSASTNSDYVSFFENEQQLYAKRSQGPRTFSRKMKQRKYEEQQGICVHCGKHFSYSEMEGDHIIPYSKGGITNYGNLQMLCRKCNRSKGNRFNW